MRKISMESRFNTAAGIAHQFSNEQGKDLGILFQRLREFGLKAHSVGTKPLISRKKNQKAILTFVEEHFIWREEN